MYLKWTASYISFDEDVFHGFVYKNKIKHIWCWGSIVSDYSSGNHLFVSSLLIGVIEAEKPVRHHLLLLLLNFQPWINYAFLAFWLVHSGRDPFNQNFRKFQSKTQWIGSVQPEKFRKNGSTFWGGPLFPVRPVGILVKWIAPSVSVISSYTLVWPRMENYYAECCQVKNSLLGNKTSLGQVDFMSFLRTKSKKVLENVIPAATKKAKNFGLKLFNGIYLWSFLINLKKS